MYFAYENGVRFNFIHNILEVYFPLYSNNGWEVSQNAYPKKLDLHYQLTFNRFITFLDVDFYDILNKFMFLIKKFNYYSK